MMIYTLGKYTVYASSSIFYEHSYLCRNVLPQVVLPLKKKKKINWGLKKREHRTHVMTGNFVNIKKLK